MMHSSHRLAFYRYRSHNQQALSQQNEAGLSNALPGLSVTVTALSVSLYGLSWCFPSLYCCNVTDTATKYFLNTRFPLLAGSDQVRSGMSTTDHFPFKYGRFVLPEKTVTV